LGEIENEREEEGRKRKKEREAQEKSGKVDRCSAGTAPMIY